VADAAKDVTTEVESLLDGIDRFLAENFEG